MTFDRRYSIFLLYIFVLSGSIVFAQKGLGSESGYLLNRVKGISGSANDYSPFLYKNTLHFVSDRSTDNPVKYFNERNEKPLTLLYKCEVTEGKLKGKVTAAGDFFSDMEYAGPSCETDSFLYITSNKKPAHGKSNSKRPLEIRQIKKNSGPNVISESLALDLPDSVSLGHPCVINDTLMFLTMNTPHGNSDLMVCRKLKGMWTKPKKLRDGINSPSNEMFPYYSAPFLYFSSDRPGGNGGLDIYIIDLSDNKTLPVLLAPPLNSAFDDFGICSSNMLSSGYLSSNRNGNDDIYYFKLDFPNFTECRPVLSNTYCFTFYEEATVSTKDTLTLSYQWSFSDGTKVKGLEAEHCFKKEGTYDIELNILERASGEVFMNQLKFTMDIKTVRQLFIDVPDTFHVDDVISFDASLSNPDSFEVKRYYWDFGDGTRSLYQIPTHKYSKAGTYVVTLGATGIYQGKEVKKCVTRKITAVTKKKEKVYSLVRPILPGVTSAIALRRIDSIYIADIAAKRKKLSPSAVKKENSNGKVIGKGSKKPGIIPELRPDDPYLIAKDIFGVQWRDSLTNYRVHLGASKVHLLPNDPAFKGLENISEFLVKDQYHYFYGKASEINGIIPYYKDAKEKGFDKSEVALFQSDVFMYDEKSGKFVNIYDTLGSEVIMTFYFESNSNQVNKEDEKKLADLINRSTKNEIKKLILKGYSDPVGDKMENMRLSRKRALAVKEIIDSKKSNDIRILYYGDTKSVNANDEDFLMYNRRVELIKLK